MGDASGHRKIVTVITPRTPPRTGLGLSPLAHNGHVAAEKASILRVKVPSCQLPDSGA
jgi:hypothetical protein